MNKYNFHHFDSLINEEDGKVDPRLRRNQKEVEKTIYLCWASAKGDLEEVRKLVAQGADYNASDYDGRTPIHLAAAEGHGDVVSYLLDLRATPNPVDRWGFTPADEAKRHNHPEVSKILSSSVSLSH